MKWVFLIFLLCLSFVSADLISIGTGGDEIIFGYGNQIDLFFSSSGNLYGIFQDINWTRTSHLLTNSSIGDILIFNNTDTSTQNISLYNLTNALLYNPETLVTYLNSTISSNTGNFTNISITAGNRIYILNHFNITENNNRPNSPIDITRISTSSMKITSSLTTVKGVEILFPQDCSTLSYISYQSSGFFSKNPSYICLNNLVSIPASEMLEIGQGENNLIIYTTSSDTGTGTGDSGTSPSVTYPNITTIGQTNETFSTINLEKIEIQNDKLCEGKDKLIFKSLDKDNKFTLLNSSILYINDSKKTNKLFLDLTNEIYYFLLENLEEGEIEVRITANQNGKYVSKTKILSIETCIKKSNLQKFKDFAKNNSDFIFYIFLILLIALAIIYVIYKSGKD